MQRNQPENARQGARYDGIDEIDPNFDGAGVRVGIVMARFNLDICEGLLSACTDELLALGGSYAHMFEVQSQYYQETEEDI